MGYMDHRQAIAALDKIDPNDPENDELPWPGPGGAHSEADDILLSVVPDEVADAYRRLIARSNWWAHS